MGRTFFLFLLGSLLLVLGISLILKNWVYVVILFQGTIGMILAIAGLVVLTFIGS